MQETGAAAQQEKSSFFVPLPSHSFSHVHVCLPVSCILVNELRKKRGETAFSLSI